MAKSTTAQLSMFTPTTCASSGSVTSSRASADGRTPCNSPTGPSSASCGPGVVPASRSRSRAPVLGATIPATFGLRGFASSASADLSALLANKLRALLPTDGWIWCSMIWSVKATPRGRRVSRLRVSARPTSDLGSGLWPTPDSNQGRGATLDAVARNKARGMKTHLRLDGVAKLALASYASWVSPQAADANGSGINQHTASLCKQARQVWSTWQTPSVIDAEIRTYQYDRQDHTKPRLSNEGQLSGAPSIGFPAPTARRGRLNPAHSRWLMGFPPVWDDCAVMGMPSSRKSRRRSSARI